jgi:ABC-type glycerol-3-phosphate transport system substrate-binding protein
VYGRNLRRVTQTRRSVIAGAVAAAGGTVLAACQQRREGGASEQVGAREAQLVVYMRDAEQEAFAKRSQEFMEKYPKIKIDFQGLPDYYTKVQAAFAGGVGPDVFYTHTSNLKYQEFAVKGIAAPIDDMLAKSKVDLSAYLGKAIEALKLDGKLYGLPVRGQFAWMFLYYNKRIFQEAGLNPPNPNWTFDDIVAAAEKLTIRRGDEVERWGYYHTYGGFEQTVAFVRNFNGEFFDPPDGPGKRCTLNSSQCLQAFQWIYDLWHKRKIATPTLNWNLFGEGKIAMVGARLAGERATVKNAVKDNFEWTFIKQPKGPGRYGGFLSTDALELRADTKYKPEAFEALVWYTNRESGIAAALQSQGSLTPGFRKDVYCSQELLNDSRFPRDAMQANCDNTNVTESYTYPHNLRLTEIEPILNKYLPQLQRNEAQPSASWLNDLAREIQVVLDMPRL